MPALTCGLCGGNHNGSGKTMKNPCKTCGEVGLHWGAVPQSGATATPKWVMFNDKGVEHKCKVAAAQAAAGTTPEAPVSAGVSPVDAGKLAQLEVDVLALKTGLKAQDPKLDAIIKELSIRPTKVDMQAALSQVDAAVQRLNAARPISLITPGSSKPKVITGGHSMLANAVLMANAVKGVGVLYLKGEAGSGKSTAFAEVFAALGKPDYVHLTFGQHTTQTDVFGFIDANGRPVDYWKVKEAVEGGWGIGFDEFDNVSAEGGVAFNTVISNKVMSFPMVGLVTKHDDTVMMAAGNTFGRGADSQYVGRAQLDGATLDRLVYCPWDTDWEHAGAVHGFKIAGDKPAFPPPVKPRTLKEFEYWGQYVKDVRDVIQDLGLRVLVTRRSIIYGAALLEAGIHTDLVEYATIWGRMSEQEANTIKSRLTRLPKVVNEIDNTTVPVKKEKEIAEPASV